VTTFAYVKKSHLDFAARGTHLTRGTDEWISVLVADTYPDSGSAAVIAKDQRSYRVGLDELVDAQEWMLGDPIEVLLGDNELTMEEAIEFAGEDVRGKTRFHRLATDPDNFEGDYGEVMWR
jgi:hypothetical protein